MKTHHLLAAAAPLALVVPSLAFAETASNTEASAEVSYDEQIFVTGSPLQTKESEVLVGASVLDGDDLQRRVAASIGETLRQEPGISSTFFGAGASRPIVRGQGGDRVRVLDNGIGSIDASSSSPDHAVAVEPAAAERIEIVRGASVLRYGSSGAGGVINVIDGRIPTEVPEGNIDLAFRAGATTVDDGEDVAGSLTAAIAEIGSFDVVVHLDGSYRNAHDYDIPGYAESARFRAMEEDEHHDDEDDHEDEDEHEEEDKDTLSNSSVDALTASGGISFIGENAFFGASFKTTESTYGIPGGHGHHGHEGEEHDDDDDDDHEDEDEHHDEHGEEEGEGVFIDLTQHRYDFKGGVTLNSSFIEALTFDAGYADYKHTEFEAPGEAGTVFRNEGWEARFEAIQRAHGNFHGAWGLHLRNRDFSAVGEEAFVPPTETNQWAVYSFQEWQSETTQVQGALRFERTEHDNTTDQITRDFDAVSVSVGGGYRVTPDVRISGSVFRTERAPTSDELFANGPHLATDQFEVGDVNLDKEISTGVEAILQWNLPIVSLTATAFYTDFEDYIYENETGEEEDELPVFVFTAADATFQGFELEGSADIGQIGKFDLSADAVVDFVDASVDVTGNDNLPRIPPLGFSAGVEADSDRFNTRLEVEYAAEQDDTSEFELPTDSHTLLHAYVSWYPAGKDSGLSFDLQGLNLTDEEARLHTSFLKDRVPLPGRNFRFNVRYTY
ncbi:MAG: TonB-dependent receptor [Pseudomonadota bacterium]